MSDQLLNTNNGFDLTIFHESLDKEFDKSVSDYTETEMHWCSQCSYFDEHLDMSYVYKDRQNEPVTEGVSKQINHFHFKLNNI